MQAALFAGITFVLSCCVISGALSVSLALIAGVGVTPQPYHVIIGAVLGAICAIFPAALVAWLVSRRRPVQY